ncbi:hypothetical protein [Bosea sp. (in: a-proteobacteria)]|uniref:hypothetical protein n=1 Tax=Bosea sp. (in: a-proteobacteria) TaxID=1871050 RepID=UPI001ACCDCEF|nr:hypothetical protein [Bosea sp. (in: a-proteobacteria)]MBN9444381.1 hypothetical protein [Bosea sp. (in: a-proteobacteria)]
MDKKPYVPTDPKATHIAGRRIRELPVFLTDSQADHELRVGAIEPFVKKEGKASTGGKKS